MSERKPQITIGAGHEESRINQEFKDFLVRWSGPFLITVTVVSLAYVAKIRWDIYQQDRRDAAFANLAAARDAGSPSNLLLVAEEHGGIGAVRDLATLAAADLHLEAFRRGVQPGALEDPQTGDFKPDDILDEQAREERLAQAESLYRLVLERTRDKPESAERAMSAYAGLASVAIGRRDWEQARATLEAQIALAGAAGLDAMAEMARQRLASFDELQRQPPVLPQDRIAVYIIPPAAGEVFQVDPAAAPEPPSAEEPTQFEQPGRSRSQQTPTTSQEPADPPTPFERPTPTEEGEPEPPAGEAGGSEPPNAESGQPGRTQPPSV